MPELSKVLRLTVKAHPNARVNRVELAETTLGVWVRARAVDGQANAAIEDAIAQALGLRKHQVRLLSGATRREKIFEVDLADLEEVRRRLAN